MTEQVRILAFHRTALTDRHRRLALGTPCLCVAVFLIWLVLCGTSVARTAVYDVASPGRLQPGTPIPPPQQEVILTVRGALGVASHHGTVKFDLPTLEQIGLVRFTTPTTWTDAPVTFEGILMSRLFELLAVASHATEAVMTALDDYQVTIPLSDVRRWPVMLALKRDGAYMSVRDKGPLWVVYPRQAFPELNEPRHDPKWIWQLKEIIVR